MQTFRILCDNQGTLKIWQSFNLILKWCIWTNEYWCLLYIYYFSLTRYVLEKEMATHSSILAWRIPGMGDPGGLPSMGLHRVRHNWSDLATAAAAAENVY